MQGGGEEQSKSYLKYDARVPQTATRQSAKSSSRVASSARKQATATKKPFAVFDIDGTLIRWQLYHALADQLLKLGYIGSEDFKAISEARLAWKRRENSDSFRQYEQKLVGLYESVLKQISPAQLDNAAEQVFDEYKDQVYTYTRHLLKKLKADGYLLFAISGSQVELISKIAGHYGFDDYAGSTYVRQDGKFTGQVIAPLGKKQMVLKELAKKHNASWTDSIAVGDSQGDIKMMEIVERPIAFNPERELFEHARAHGWPVVLERKNMFYELEPQGESFILA